MEVVILCGGKGTRLKEETEYKPKPLVTVGDMPILWHIMKGYSHFNHHDFVLALGYKGHLIQDYFRNIRDNTSDYELSLDTGLVKHLGDLGDIEKWKITFAKTGQESGTAHRLKRVQQYIKGNEFMLTYGDGVADVNLEALVEQHRKSGVVATVTGVMPLTKYGILQTDGKIVTEMKEKPALDNANVNGGFMILNREVFDYIPDTEGSMLEQDVLPRLASERKLGMYDHKGFWHCMDTPKDHEELNKIWNEKPPWKVWK